MGVLNRTSTLVDAAESGGLNRYELTLAVARMAKESAYRVEVRARCGSGHVCDALWAVGWTACRESR